MQSDANEKLLPCFETAWAAKAAEGYLYGSNEIELVKMGWDMALSAPRTPSEPPKQGSLTFEQHQEEMAKWLGASNVWNMNNYHDLLHRELCKWLGFPSYALMPEETKPQELAALEEVAVLHLQRFIHHVWKNKS